MAQAHYELVLRAAWETPKRVRKQRHLFDPSEIYAQPQFANEISRLEEEAKTAILLFVDVAQEVHLHRSYLRVRQHHQQVLDQLKRSYTLRDLRCIGSKPTIEKLLSVIKLY